MQIPSAMSLKARLTLVIITLTAGFIIFGAWSFATLDKLKVNGALYQRIIQGKDLIADILPPPEYIIESYLVTLQMMGSTDKSELEAFAQRFEQLQADYKSRHQYWKEQNLEANLHDTLLTQSYEPAERFYRLAENEFMPAVLSGNTARANQVLELMRKEYEQHRAAIDQVVSLATERNANDEKRAAEQISSALIGMGIVFVLAMGLAIALMYLTSRDLLRKLGGEPGDAERLAKTIATGDLTGQDIAHNGLLGSLTDMRNKLRTMVENIAHYSTQLSCSSEELSAVSNQSNQMMEKLQNEAHQVVSAIEEMSATSSEVSNSTNTVAIAARQANNQSHSGRKIVNAARSNVGNLAQKVDHAASVVNKLDLESAKIGSVVDTISGIAEQTNLLALNAAIEAARAGDQGRGFAVVADEVRNLASRTQQATKEIQQIILQLKDGVTSAVVAMNESKENVTESMKHMDLADGALKTITDDIENINLMADQIAAAVEQQSITIRSIAANMVDIQQSTETTSAGSLQTNSATQELARLASELNQMTQKFRVSS